MSPKGLKAPPAFAATTMLMQAGTTNRGDCAPTEIATAPITSVVVRLSAIGDMQNAMAPVAQKIPRNESPRLMSHVRSTSKTCRSSSVFTKLTAASMKRNSCANSKMFSWRKVEPLTAAGETATRIQSTPAAMIIGIDFRRCVCSSRITRR